MDMETLNTRAGAVAVSSASRTHDSKNMAPVGTAAQAADRQANPVPAGPDREKILAAVADMQDFVQAARRNIEFQLDDDSGRMLVTVTEADSGEVIRQIPSEEALRLAENLSEIRSVLFRGEA